MAGRALSAPLDKKKTAIAPAPMLTDRQKTLWLPLLLIGVVAMALRAPLAAIPLERDEGEYAYIAQRWLDGAVPYQDSFDQKPPGVFVAYAFIMRLVGGSPAAIHWCAQVYALGTLALIFLIGRHLFSPAAGMVAGIFAAFLMADKGVLGNAANTETFMLLPLTAGFLTTLLSVERQSIRWAIATGVCAGMSVLFKQVAVTSFLFCLLYMAWASPARFRLIAATVLAAVAVVLPTVAYFYLKGAIHEFYDCVIGYNIRYTQNVPLDAYPKNFWIHASEILKDGWPIYLLAAVGAGAAWAGGSARAQPGGRRAVTLLSLWLAFGFVAVVAGGVFRHHYFLQIVPAVAVLAGGGADVVCRPLQRFLPANAPAELLPTGLAAVCVACGLYAGSYYYTFERSATSKARALYASNPFVESPALGRFLAEHTRPTDTVLVIGSEPQIYYYAHRKCASRYIFIYPLMNGFPDTIERQARFLEDLRENRPRYVIYVTPPVATGSFLFNPGTNRQFLPTVSKQLEADYRFVGFAPFPPAPDGWFPPGVSSDPWTREELERVYGTLECPLITDRTLVPESSTQLDPQRCLLRLFKLK